MRESVDLDSPRGRRVLSHYLVQGVIFDHPITLRAGCPASHNIEQLQTIGTKNYWDNLNNRKPRLN